MDNTNRIYVERALDLMVEGLLDPFDELMNKHYEVAENWTEAWAKKERDRHSKPGQRPPELRTYSKTDPQFQMRVILETFQIFKRAGYSNIIKSHAGEIKDKVRNPSAHRSSFFSDEEAQRALETIALLLTEFGAHDQADAVRALRDDRKRVVVGSPVGVGTVYQPRQSDDKISELFSDSGDRRLWLRGGQGFGKSFAARKVVEDALATSGDEREDVVIWVDSANPRSVIAALSSVVDRMPELKIDVALDDPDRAEKQARALLEVLATCRWRWLIVFDNADAGALIEQKLIPVGTNPNGRLLVTTLSHDQRIPTWGRIVNLEVFTPREADDFITSRLNPQTGEVSFLADVDETQRIDLAKALGYHPLALSIATATIITHNLSIPLWLSELQTGKLDQAADVEDPGGYPLLVGASFRAALNRAAIDVPLSVLERAAAAVAFFSNDGVPTWIFDLPEFRSWIFGNEEIATRHGKPYVFQSLLNHGLIQLDSNTWDVASITMHQLVARAMVENFTTDDFLELVEALISFDNSDMEIEIMERAYETWPQTARVITGLSHNPEVTKDPRLKYLLSSSNEFYYDEYSKSNDRLPFPVIDNYQDFPQERWLGQALLKQGEQQKTLGQHDQAEESWTQALDVFQKCSELDPEKQLLILREIGYLQNKLGYEQKASDSYRSALEISENLPQTLNLVARVRRSTYRANLLRTLGMQEEALTESESGLQLASETPPETPIMKKVISVRLNESLILSLFEVHGKVGAMELPRYFEMRTQIFADLRGLNRLYEKGHPSLLLIDLLMIDTERIVLEPRDSNEDKLGLMKEKLAEISELRANDPTNIKLIETHATAAAQFGFVLQENGDLSEAAEFHSLAIELFKTVFDLTPENRKVTGSMPVGATSKILVFAGIFWLMHPV